MRLFLALFCAAVLWIFPASVLGAGEEAVYIGSGACAECHPDEHEHYSKYAKKAKSFESVRVMAQDLTPEELGECYGCHTTGYGEPSGFRSEEETPELANAGCEVCHGPGSRHVEEGGDPEYIRDDLSIEDCQACHNKERISAFDYKPLLFGGAH